MASTAESTGFSQLPKRERGETSKQGLGEPAVKRLKNEEAEDPDEQWRLRMRKARQLKQHNRAMVREASNHAPLEVRGILTTKLGSSCQSWCQQTHEGQRSPGYRYSGV